MTERPSALLELHVFQSFWLGLFKCVISIPAVQVHFASMGCTSSAQSKLGMQPRKQLEDGAKREGARQREATQREGATSLASFVLLFLIIFPSFFLLFYLLLCSFVVIIIIFFFFLVVLVLLIILV